MCWVCLLCRRLIGLPPPRAPMDPEMARLAHDFRQGLADQTAEILDSRAQERDAYIAAREQNAWLKAKRIDLEKRLMARGIDLPDDDP